MVDTGMLSVMRRCGNQSWEKMRLGSRVDISQRADKALRWARSAEAVYTNSGGKWDAIRHRGLAGVCVGALGSSGQPHGTGQCNKSKLVSLTVFHLAGGIVCPMPPVGSGGFGDIVQGLGFIIDHASHLTSRLTEPFSSTLLAAHVLNLKDRIIQAPRKQYDSSGNETADAGWLITLEKIQGPQTVQAISAYEIGGSELGLEAECWRSHHVKRDR